MSPTRGRWCGGHRRGRRPAHRPGRRRDAQESRGAGATAPSGCCARRRPTTCSRPSGPAAGTCRCVRRRRARSRRCSKRRGVEPGVAAFAARASQGHIGRARALARDEAARSAAARRDRAADPAHRPGCVPARGGQRARGRHRGRRVGGRTDGGARAADHRDEWGTGTRGIKVRGEQGAMSDLKKMQKARRTRLVRDAVDRALLDLLSYYRDVLSVQLGRRGPLVNEEAPARAHRARATYRPGADAAPGRRRAGVPHRDGRAQRRAAAGAGAGVPAAAGRAEPRSAVDDAPPVATAAPTLCEHRPTGGTDDGLGSAATSRPRARVALVLAPARLHGRRRQGGPDARRRHRSSPRTPPSRRLPVSWAPGAASSASPSRRWTGRTATVASSARPSWCPSTTTTWAATRSGLPVDRLPADDRDARIGSLLVNPGGPGASGVDYVQSAGRQFGDACAPPTTSSGSTRAASASSEPVECVGTEELDELIASEAIPDDDAEVQEVAATSCALRRCVRAGAARPAWRTCRPSRSRVTSTFSAPCSATTSCTTSGSPTAPDRIGLRRAVPRAGRAGWCSTGRSTRAVAYGDELGSRRSASRPRCRPTSPTASPSERARSATTSTTGSQRIRAADRRPRRRAAADRRP